MRKRILALLMTGIMGFSLLAGSVSAAADQAEAQSSVSTETAGEEVPESLSDTAAAATPDEQTDAADADTTAGSGENKAGTQTEAEIPSGGENTQEGETPGTGEASSEDKEAVTGETEAGEAGEGEIQESRAGASGEDIELPEVGIDEEEDPFEETGIFGCYTVDSYGSVIHGYTTGNGVWYLFLTNTGDIGSFPVYCTGVKPVEVSAGELDRKTHVISGAFAASGDILWIAGSNGESYRVVAMQSGLPSLCITLNGTTLDYINSHSKDDKYSGNSLLLTDENGDISLVQEGTVQIKGRGNTTWDSATKRGYQIKFDKKQKVLGMAKAKKWILLASAFDDSMARNMTAFYSAAAMDMEYVTEYRYVDLWVDGDYQGTYMLGEKAEIGDNRLNLTDPLGILVERDGFFYAQEDAWFKDKYIGWVFAAKECVDEDTPGNLQKALDAFEANFDRFWQYVSSTPAASITYESLSRYIDVESFAKWYLINEFNSNVESSSTSCYFYMDGPSDVIHMGPVWDFDSCMGNKKSYSAVDLMYFKTNNVMFRKLLQIPAFSNYLAGLLVRVDEAFAGQAAFVRETAEKISASADMNYLRWNYLGKDNQKSDLNPFAPTFSSAIDYLSNWLTQRYNFFSTKAEVTASLENNAVVVRINDGRKLSGVRAAAWTEDRGQDDLVWKNAGRNADGTFTLSYPVQSFASVGRVIIHVYSNHGYAGAATVEIPVPQITYSLSEDGKTLTIAADGSGIFNTLHTAVWSSKNGQDDLVWYTLKKDAAGSYTATVNLRNHGKSDTYYFHTYGIVGSREMFVSAKTENVVMDIPAPAITLEKNESGTRLAITLKNASDEKNVRFAVWGAENGQNDLKWYNATLQADGTWTYTVNLNSHRENGKLYVDCWAASGYLTGSTEELSFPETPEDKPVLTVTPAEDGTAIICSLTGAYRFDRVRFPAWTTAGGQDDLVWYEASSDGEGNWTYTIRTSRHGGGGEYIVHCYGITDGVQKAVGGKTVNVPAPAVVKPSVTAAWSGNRILVSALNASGYTNVRFAVWTSDYGQDDLRWYTAVKQADGSWTYSVNPSVHTPGTVLNFHAYGYLNGKDTFIAAIAMTK